MLGTSTPTAVLPGIGASTRTSVAASAYLRSSLRLATLLDLDAGLELQLVPRDARPGDGADDLRGDVEALQRRDETLGGAGDGVGRLAGRPGPAAAGSAGRAAPTGAAPPRRRRAPPSPPASSSLSAAAAAAAASESCTPSSAATTGSGDGSSGSGAASPKISGASEAPSMRCGAVVGTGREKSRSGDAAGLMDVRMRSLASMVGDSSSSTTRVPAASLRRAPMASAWLRAARPALATPCLECAAHWRSDDPVTSNTPATTRATTRTSTPTRPMNGLSTAHWTSPSSPPCVLMYASRKSRVGALAAEDAEGVGRGGERHPDDDQRDAPAEPAPRPALLPGDEKVGDEPEQQRQREGEDAEQPAGGVAEPAAERAAVPAEVEHEGEEDGDGEAGDRTQLAAMPRALGRRVGLGCRGAGARTRPGRGARTPACLFRACSRHEADVRRPGAKP